MEEENYFGDTSKKTRGFVIALIVLLLCVGITVNTDLAQFAQHTEINIPMWFFYVIFGLDVVMVLSVVAIYFYKKVGVFAFPIAAIIHMVMNSFYLSTIRYSDLNVLFFFFATALFVTIPRWKYFK